MSGYSSIKEIDYVKHIKRILGIDKSKAKSINEERKTVKDMILMGKQQKMIDNIKAVNSS